VLAEIQQKSAESEAASKSSAERTAALLQVVPLCAKLLGPVRWTIAAADSLSRVRDCAVVLQNAELKQREALRALEDQHK
jgi:hypothetical protein